MQPSNLTTVSTTSGAAAFATVLIWIVSLLAPDIEIPAQVGAAITTVAVLVIGYFVTPKGGGEATVVPRTLIEPD